MNLVQSTIEYLQVRQGECQICDSDDVVLTALLGSCVAACIWDQSANVGGMNHILLPGQTTHDREALYRGTNAMEVLINGLLRRGARQENMRVKLLGGARMYDGVFDIGQRNSDFVTWFVENENLSLMDTCLGGTQGRMVRFWPLTGRVQRRFVVDQQLMSREAASATTSNAPQDDGEVELF